ncbi:hypothetical protein Leryth_025811 [Lithospermum erythrorhizon]|nr:hypothetical protein Leryth_025811 [Lithospermum erythrorhizon]
MNRHHRCLLRRKYCHFFALPPPTFSQKVQDPTIFALERRDLSQQICGCFYAKMLYFSTYLGLFFESQKVRGCQRKDEDSRLYIRRHQTTKSINL